jgi:hypothetical protein
MCGRKQSECTGVELSLKMFNNEIWSKIHLPDIKYTFNFRESTLNINNLLVYFTKNHPKVLILPKGLI